MQTIVTMTKDEAVHLVQLREQEHDDVEPWSNASWLDRERGERVHVIETNDGAVVVRAPSPH